MGRFGGAVLALGVFLGTSGCGGSETLVIYGPGNAATGEPALFTVAADLPCGGKVFGGPSDPTGALMICRPYHDLTKIVSATCDGLACTVDSVDAPSATGAIAIHVVGNIAGPTTLRVRAELDDGSQLSATSSLSFVTPTGLHLACDVSPAGVPTPDGQCGGFYPVFANSYWRWTVSFDSDAGLLPAYSTSVGLQGSAVGYDPTTGWFGASPTDATTQITISTRQFTKVVPVRIVSPAEVVSGEVRLVAPGDGVDQAIAQLGPAPTTLWSPPRNGERFDGDAGANLLSLLTLSDGTQVYGGAGLFTSDHPEVCTLDPLPAGANLAQQTSLAPDCHAAGSATFSATIGAAAISWPVTVAPPL